MLDTTQINEKLTELQSSSINCGGIWEVRLFDKFESNDNALSVLARVFLIDPRYNNLKLHREFAEKGGWNPEERRLIKNLELIEIEDWPNYFEKRIEYWSNFEIISIEERTLEFNQELFLEKKKNFKEALNEFLNRRKLSKVYKIDENKFETYTLWREQISEDFVFELENEILTLSFGWSS
jgi:hypothetical protein